MERNAIKYGIWWIIVNSGFMDNLVAKIHTFTSNKYMKAISRGMVSTIPFTITGSVVVLLKAIPFEFWQSFLTTVNAGFIFSVVQQYTTNFLAVWVVIFIGSNIVKSFGQDAITGAVVTLLSFLAITPITKIDDVGSFLSYQWLGSAGMVTAIVVALIVGRFYVFLMEKKVYIRMPDSVPPFIEKSFAAIIPFLIITVLSATVSSLVALTSYGSVHGFIYQILAIPLRLVGSNIVGVIIAYMFMNILWFFGIHGKSIVFGVMAPIWAGYTVENMNAALAGSSSPHIIEFGFTRLYAELGGAGSSLALVICMLLFSKSKQYKAMGKMFSISSICGISEPVTFGAPMVLNFKFLIPMLAAPTVTLILGYALTSVGILPKLSGISVPTGTPILLDAFLIGGLPHLIMQLVVIVISVLIYLPFFISSDKELLLEEQKAEENGEVLEAV